MNGESTKPCLTIKLPRPYLLFLGDVTEAAYAKTAFGLRDWAPELCVGEYALPAATVTTGLTRLTPKQAFERVARALVIGVANTGGVILSSWIPPLLESLEAGLDIVSGMHSRLAAQAELKHAAARLGRQLIDVRSPPRDLPIASGRKRSGKRLLTVGTDCALGKKYTALALTRAFKRLGVDAEYRATGQTGILISGAGIPIDAVVSDFVAGAAETLTPDAPDYHWDVVEGQGSIFHPSYSGVSLGLLHGTQPDVIVVCHEVGRDRILGLEDYVIPALEEAIDLHLRLARRTNPQVRCAGVSLNTSSLSEAQARTVLAQHAASLRLPVADPMRGGHEFEQLAAACLAER
jgi:D-glutamate N-acetyltransferase